MFKRLFLLCGLSILAGSIWWSPDIQQIGAGVAIFLFGMLSMDEGFRAFTGGTLERFLSTSTNKLWKSLGFGILATTIVQSSSLVSVITISFLSSGLLELVQGIGIIFGANIGTTTGAWLVSAIGLKVKISAYAMPMLMVGIVLVMQNRKTLKGIGHILTGLGFLFLGIHFMKEGFEAFRSAIDLSAYAVAGWQGLLLYTTFGVIATVIMQSSHATLVLIITALATGQISYENAIALAIGANIGTTVTAIIGALGANSAGKQLAAAHLVFNGITAFVALLLLQPLIQVVEVTSHWFGIGEQEYALKLSLFHTIFNVLGVLIMLPFIKVLARQLKKLIGDDRRTELNLPAHRPDRRLETVKPKYVTNVVMNHPDTALNAIIQEVTRLWSNSIAVMSYALYLNRSDVESEQPLDLILATSEIHGNTSDIDELYLRYIRPLNTVIIEATNRVPKPMSKVQSETLFSLKLACRDLVNAVKDVKHLQKNVVLYHESEIPALQATYQQFRMQLAQLLHNLQNVLNYPDEEEALLAFSQEQKNLQENDIVRNGRLDTLIQRDEIPSRYITSLMNDSQYCLDIGSRLLQMAENLYWAKSGSNRSNLTDLILDSSEISELQHG
jgi:phosphate:Na+ symporter